ncbi:hypothetical protein [Teredinibacter sp. KSP-S5-2]|uniref:hypothetical protein n=1 Tax=Teredinibacter sp. KSP-S5-2 TaxID=3034506 RepID=UPI0029343E4F|nr:hypothetical protein [Teredinibacter sp. KSP-S5-2]WNO10410.1 hypothetical protein P5V12_04425 [Teredinibacter sp. KSP-S5-2]
MSDSIAEVGATSYAQAKTANEVIKVQKSTVQLEQLKSSVVSRDKVLIHVHKIASKQRATWMPWVEECAQSIAEKFSVDSEKVKSILHTEVAAHLKELGDVHFTID